MKTLVCVSNDTDIAAKIAFTNNNVQFLLNAYTHPGKLHEASAAAKTFSGIKPKQYNQHVIQTGIAVGTNSYIAIGLPGAIQHLKIDASEVASKLLKQVK